MCGRHIGGLGRWRYMNGLGWDALPSLWCRRHRCWSRLIGYSKSEVSRWSHWLLPLLFFLCLRFCLTFRCRSFFRLFLGFIRCRILFIVVVHQVPKRNLLLILLPLFHSPLPLIRSSRFPCFRRWYNNLWSPSASSRGCTHNLRLNLRLHIHLWGNSLRLRLHSGLRLGLRLHSGPRLGLKLHSGLGLRLCSRLKLL